MKSNMPLVKFIQDHLLDQHRPPLQDLTSLISRSQSLTLILASNTKTFLPINLQPTVTITRSNLKKGLRGKTGRSRFRDFSITKLIFLFPLPSVSLPASSPSSRFARPDFEQFRPAEFNQEPSYQADQQNVRPLRHASYPSTFSDDSRAPSSSFDYKPESVPSFDVDYKQPSFSETTKQFKNFFVDHNSNHFNRPSRSSPTYETSYEEPSYEIKRPLTPPTSFEPLPPSTRPVNRHR